MEQTDLESGYYPKKLSGLEKYAVRRFHPGKIMMDAAGWMWGVYLLWNQRWLEALIAVLVVSALSTLMVRRADAEQMAETSMGRLALLHLHPMNILLQTVGFIYLILGIYSHHSIAILGGLSIVFFGHAFGWERVDSRFGFKYKGEGARVTREAGPKGPSEKVA